MDGAGNPGGTVTYYSSDTSVVTVDSQGNVTVVGAGYAQIIVSAAPTELADGVTLAVTVSVSESAGEGGGIGDIIDGILNVMN